MKIKILKLKGLNRAQTRTAAALISCCNIYDGTHYGFPEDADGYYLLYEDGKLAAILVLFLMGEHLNCKEIYELAAFTLPDRRRRAYYSRLISAVRDKLRGQYARYAVYDNAAAVMTLKSRGTKHSHDELMLMCNLDDRSEIANAHEEQGRAIWNQAYISESANNELHANTQGDVLVITDDAADSSLNAMTDDDAYIMGHAQSDFGECYFRIDKASHNAYVFGVQTYANYLRQGHAYRLLGNLYEELKGRGVKTVSLQVSSENTAALRLYEKLGMKEIERLSFYIEQL